MKEMHLKLAALAGLLGVILGVSVSYLSILTDFVSFIHSIAVIFSGLSLGVLAYVLNRHTKTGRAWLWVLLIVLLSLSQCKIVGKICRKSASYKAQAFA